MSTSETITAERAYTDVLSHEAILRRDHEHVDLVPGDAYVQGDVVVARLDRRPKKAGVYAGRQLAPGSTQGSRHIAEGDVELYTPDEAEALAIIHRLFPKTRGHGMFLGPVVVSQGSGWTQTHPEHGDRTYSDAGVGCDLVVYQRAFAETIRRAQD